MFIPYQSNLIAVSSFRPLAECSEETAANQLRAKRSWDQVFTEIYLFGPEEKQLASPTTHFIPSENWPSIALMALTASWQDEPVCILNADIVVSPSLKDFTNRAWQANGLAVTSWRCEFDPRTEDYDNAKVVDMGVDFFCAFPVVWQQVYKAIPPGFRLGHSSWDNWLLGFLNHRCVRRFYDISRLRPIYHPKHGSRNMPHHIIVPPDCFFAQTGFPPALT